MVINTRQIIVAKLVTISIIIATAIACLGVKSENLTPIDNGDIMDNSHQFAMAAEEIAYLKKLGEIKMCVDPDWMPFEKIDSSGRHIGLLSDYMKLFSQRLKIPFRLIRSQSYRQSKVFLAENRCDIISADVHTEQTSSNFLTTQPYLVSPRVFAVHIDTPYIADFSQVKDKKVAYVTGSPAEELLPQLYPNVTPIGVKTIDAGLHQVATKQSYAFINILGAVTYSLQQQNLLGVKIGGVLPSNIRLSVLINREHSELLPLLNRVIDSINGEERKVIFERWISVQFEQGIDYDLIIKIMLGALLVFGGLSYRNLELKKLNQAIANANREALESNAKLLSIQLELEKSNRELETLSITDKLTGLYNRVKLDGVFETELDRCRRYKGKFSIILADVDYFKKVNDELGHQVGDKVLIDIAELLTRLLRRSDTVGRWGGEEFLVIVPNANSEQASLLAEKLRKSVANHHFSHVDQCTCSFGVSSYFPGDDEDSLLSRADHALYQAKEEGRNRVVTAADEESRANQRTVSG